MMSIACKRSLVLVAFGFAVAPFCSAGNVMRGAKANHRAGDTPAIAEYFGTKSRYEEVNPHLIDDALAVNESLLKLPYNDCVPVHLTAVIRHGTRYPTAKNIKKLHQLHKVVLEKAQDLGEGWLDEIKNRWKMDYTDDIDGNIAEKGREDHRNLAVRLAKTFPSLFTADNFRQDRMQFITSTKPRCEDSAKAFIQGLVMHHWELKGPLDVEKHLQRNDNLMRFFEHCRRFVVDVEENKTALKEVDLFKTKAEMKTVLEKVASRLHTAYSDLTPDLIEAAFYLCSYEFAIKTVNSPWCNLFDEEDAKVLEYGNDLKQYWKRTYGHEINQKSSCPLFHDLFERLDKAAEDSKKFATVEKPVTIQVGHAETLLPLLSLMGFFKDEVPLTSDNFAQQQNRTFRSSQIVPYASNLVFVLHRCRDSHRVQLLLNEKPLPFPSSSDPAPEYHSLRDLYGELLEGCDARRECELPNHNLSNAEL
nr:PREDICTED: multiple inositol polyphosphate phosphatase 1 [Lepisosteus oculatus]